jgi:hypothetical protein
VVAVVDGTPLRAKDMVIFTPGGEERGESLSPEMFEFLRERAIDRLLVTREAERRGIGLGPEALAEIEKLALQFRYGPEVIAAAAPEAARVAFEQEEARGMLLLRALAESEGERLLPTDDDVAAYLREHAAELSPLPADPVERVEKAREIDAEARAALAAGRWARCAAARTRLLEQLRGAARIEKSAPPGA